VLYQAEPLPDCAEGALENCGAPML
jgi:hypothetical protein